MNEAAVRRELEPEVGRLANAMGSGPDGAVEALCRFGSLLLMWNERINITGARTPAELVREHFVDAFAAARIAGAWADAADGGIGIIDVGSGGGLPALPLALLLPAATFELWEPVAKKVAFLRTAVRSLGLGARVRVDVGRVEAPAGPLADRFDLAMSRATFAPEAWRTLGLQLVRPGGRVLVFGTAETQLPGPDPVATVAYEPGRRLLAYERA